MEYRRNLDEKWKKYGKRRKPEVKAKVMTKERQEKGKMKNRRNIDERWKKHGET